MNASARIPLLLVVLGTVVVAALASGCSAAASPAPSAAPSAASASAAPSIRPNASPTEVPTPSAIPRPTVVPPTLVIPPKTADDAAQLALAQDPRFAGIRPRNPDMIGQASWYEVRPAGSGWVVTIQMGSGDCQAGCINRHTWTYQVDADGTATLVSDTGDPVEGGSGGSGGGSSGGEVAIPVPLSGGPFVVGRATAGPVCPVVRNPPDPACDPRPVPGATVVVTDAAGSVVGTTTTGADGVYVLAVPAGSYTVTAQPVEGLMGTPAPVSVVVPAGASAFVQVNLDYDTGIR